jgi:hypothetical protein
MFCPRCGSSQGDDLKFCKACGANLYAVRQVVDTRDTGEKFDLSKTWVAEMFMSGAEAQRRKEEIDSMRGITPAVRRYQEIKAGVIVSSTGLALAIFLHVFMEGITDGGKVSAAAVEILSKLWVVGVIPLFVGIALMINGYFVSRKIVELAQQTDQFPPNQDAVNDPLLRSSDTSEFVPSPFSVTEGTTHHLGGPQIRGQRSEIRGQGSDT